MGHSDSESRGEQMDDDELYDTIHSAVRDALAEQHKKNPALEILYLLLAVWLGIAALDYLSYARWVNKFRYAIWYSIDGSQVQQSEGKPPSDCDFLKAPIGLNSLLKNSDSCNFSESDSSHL